MMSFSQSWLIIYSHDVELEAESQPIMDELSLYGKRLLGIKADNICVGKSAGGTVGTVILHGR